MVWRIGTPSYKALRTAYRHRLYAFGMCTWILTLGLVVAGFQWNPSKPPVQKFVPAKVLAQDAEPQVAGAVTVHPTDPSSSENNQGLQVVSGGTAQRLVMPTKANPDPGQSSSPIPAIVLPTEENPDPGQTPTVPVIVLPPASPDPGQTLPPADPGPTEPLPPEPPATPPAGPPPPPPPPAGPTLNPACTVDPSLNVALSATAAVTVPVGGQTASQTVGTSDNSEVIWQPGGPIVWGDGTNTDTTSPVSMVLTYNPGVITGSSAAFFIRALETATPGATYTVSWHAEDGTRGICQTVTIQVTVEAAAPPPATP